MMYNTLLLLGCILMLSSSPVYALFCGSSIVSEGDEKIEVLRKCGEPTVVEERVVYETFHIDPYGRQLHQPPQHSLHGIPPGHRTITVPVQIEIWTYNFGPHRLIYRLRFVESTLREMRTLGYGY